MSHFFITHNDIVPSDVKALNALLHTLSTNATDKSWEHWNTLMRYSYLFVAFNNNTSAPVGMLTLVPHYQPMGYFGAIEDVVTAPEVQGNGIGTLLLNEVVREARELRMEALKLTSNPTRTAARRWYEKMGFQYISETGKFTMNLKTS